MSQQAFHNKWAAIRAGGAQMNLEEKSIYVEKGEIPSTQRQMSLFHYFQFIREHLEKIDAKNVIELGCGRGTIGLYCKTYMGLDVSLMDNEEDAVAIAKEAFQSRNLDAAYIVGDACATGLPENSYDATVSIGLSEHLDDVEPLFAEQLRILRPGGVMVSLNIPKKGSVQYLNIGMRAVKKCLGMYKDKLNRDYYRNTYNAKQYEQFAKNVGFIDTKITHVCPFAFYIPIRQSTDRFLTTVRRGYLKLRSLWMHYPYACNPMMAQAHFLVAYKPKETAMSS